MSFVAERSLSAFGGSTGRFGQAASQTFFKRTAPRLTQSNRSRSSTKTMASLKVYVKGDPATKTLLDCPFCHRVLLTLEQKHVPYEKEYIDTNNKPEWLQEKSGGKVPVINDGDFWLPDSDEIVKYLDEKYPESSMASDVPAEVTGGFFGAFRNLLLAKPEEAEEKKNAFVQEMGKVESYLESHKDKGPYFGGNKLSATDASFAPKAYHALVALKHFKDWTLDPEKYPALGRYYTEIQKLPEWKQTDYGKEAIVKGWSKFF